MSALAVACGVLVVAFGYLDDELGELRRSFGCGLIVAGIAMLVPAVRRLAEDWPRRKPEHNVDLAFAQIALGLVVLFVASALGGRPEKFLAPLLHPTPAVTATPSEETPASASPRR